MVSVAPQHPIQLGVLAVGFRHRAHVLGHAAALLVPLPVSRLAFHRAVGSLPAAGTQRERAFRVRQRGSLLRTVGSRDTARLAALKVGAKLQVHAELRAAQGRHVRVLLLTSQGFVRDRVTYGAQVLRSHLDALAIDENTVAARYRVKGESRACLSVEVRTSLEVENLHGLVEERCRRWCGRCDVVVGAEQRAHIRPPSRQAWRGVTSRDGRSGCVPYKLRCALYMSSR
eukprot:scaffold27472_cov90-Phaeocystis_antarctica.AAC.3